MEEKKWWLLYAEPEELRTVAVALCLPKQIGLKRACQKAEEKWREVKESSPGSTDPRLVRVFRMKESGAFLDPDSRRAKWTSDILSLPC